VGASAAFARLIAIILLSVQSGAIAARGPPLGLLRLIIAVIPDAGTIKSFCEARVLLALVREVACHRGQCALNLNLSINVSCSFALLRLGKFVPQSFVLGGEFAIFHRH
jgi:hypothetical protein